MPAPPNVAPFTAKVARVEAEHRAADADVEPLIVPPPLSGSVPAWAWRPLVDVLVTATAIVLVSELFRHRTNASSLRR